MITISLAEDWLTPCQITLGLSSNKALSIIKIYEFRYLIW